jgi:ABC-2 type transport system permease protein
MGRESEQSLAPDDSLPQRARALWAHRSVLWLLIRRDLKVRYASSVLGYLWTVLDPLLMAGVYWLVFSFIFERGNGPEQPYVLFLVLGLLSWQWFSASITDCARALTAESRLVRSTQLPREIWVLKVVGAKAIEFLLSLPIIILFALIFRRLPHWEIVLLPIAVCVQGLLLVGLGLAMASVTALVQDLQRVVRIGLRVLFYLSPVIYSVVSIKQEWARYVLSLNPMTGIIELYRSMFYDANWPSLGIALGLSVGLAFGSLMLGAIIFRRLERPLLKEL